MAQWYRGRRFLIFVNVFLLFGNYLPLEKGRSYIWTNLNPFHTRMHLNEIGPVASLIQIGPVVLQNFFWNLVNVFSLLCNYYLPLKKSRPLCLNKLEFPSRTQVYFMSSLVEIGQVVLQKKIFELGNVFTLFLNCLPSEKGMGLHFKKFKNPLHTRVPRAKFCWN